MEPATSACSSPGVKPRSTASPSTEARLTASWLAPRAMKSTCPPAAFASWPREMSPAAQNAGASATADERRRRVRSRSKNAAAPGIAQSGLQPDRGVSLLAAAVVANARDLAVADDDDLEEARHEAARSEPLEPAAPHLHEHTVAELDHLAWTQTVRSEER